MTDDMPKGITITSNEPRSNGNGDNLLDQLVAAFAKMDDAHVNSIVQKLLPGILRYDLIAPRIWGDSAHLIVPDSVNINDAFFDTTSGTITIEDDCSIGHRCKFIAIGKDNANILVKRGAVVESGATLIGPCIIEEKAIIKAGSVVTGGTVPAGEMWQGNPAKKLSS